MAPHRGSRVRAAEQLGLPRRGW
ncbi:hypothetical protein [Arthrobacter sp.]